MGTARHPIRCAVVRRSTADTPSAVVAHAAGWRPDLRETVDNGIVNENERSGGRVRILVVEDELHAREAVQRFLEFRGHEVRIAATAEEAWHSATRHPPDVLVCDWKLDGGIDGVDTAARLQRRYDLSVILVTGHRIEDLKRKARRSGVSVSVFRRKPLSLARLADAIEGMQEGPGGGSRPLTRGTAVALSAGAS